MAKRKKKTPKRKLKDKLGLAVKTYVKLRDNNECQMCGQKVFGANCHASHVIPVSQDGRLAFIPDNLKVLCFHCHLHVWHKSPCESGHWFRTTFPERWRYLEGLRLLWRGAGTISMEWYEDQLRHIEELIEELANDQTA